MFWLVIIYVCVCVCVSSTLTLLITPPFAPFCCLIFSSYYFSSCPPPRHWTIYPLAFFSFTLSLPLFFLLLFPWLTHSIKSDSTSGWKNSASQAPPIKKFRYLSSILAGCGLVFALLYCYYKQWWQVWWHTLGNTSTSLQQVEKLNHWRQKHDFQVCHEAQEMFCGLWRFRPLASRSVGNDWLFFFEVNCSFKLLTKE